MFLYLFQLLNHLGMQVPAAFQYASTRMILSALTALFCTIFLGPRVIKKLYELKTGQSISVVDCPVLAELHQKKKETPSMGGVLILMSMLISLFLWMDLANSYTWVLFATTVWLACIGGYDDYLKMVHKNWKGLSGKMKLAGQVGFAVLLGIYMIYTQKYAGWYFLPFLKDPLFILSGAGLIVGILITAFVVTGTSNAVNLTDGLDGLVSGCLVIASFVFALVAFLSNNSEIARYLNIIYIEGSGEIAIYLCAMIGALLGFLWYNGFPAQVFMGDVGSLSLGAILGVSAVLLRREVLLAIVGGIFVAEALSVILQVASYKWRNKKRIFLCSPLHHHYEYKGWPETKVVLRFWIVGLLLALVGIISLKLQ